MAWLTGRIRLQPDKEEEKQEGPLYTLQATPNELIALLQQFQARLVANLPAPAELGGNQ